MVLEKERKKKTRIVCTIGPASEDKKVLTKLVQAGMNVMRLNFSHIRSQGFGCSPIKAVRELGSERRETVRSPLGAQHIPKTLLCHDGGSFLLWCVAELGPLWRKRHLPRVGGGCLAEGGKEAGRCYYL